MLEYLRTKQAKKDFALVMHKMWRSPNNREEANEDDVRDANLFLKRLRTILKGRP